MTPGQKRGFTALASLTLATAALGGTVSAQEPANIDNLMFGSEYAPTEGTPGGSVVIADWQVPDNLNYYLQNAFVNTQVISAAFDSLWDVSSDFKYIPELSVSIPKISDGSIRIDAEPTAECANRPEGTEDVPGFEVDLNIRPGLKWSDGETLDLNDLKYTRDWILSGPTGLAARHHRLGHHRPLRRGRGWPERDAPFLHRLRGHVRPAGQPAAAGALHVDHPDRGRVDPLLPRGTVHGGRPGLGSLQVREPEPERHRVGPQRQLEEPMG